MRLGNSLKEGFLSSPEHCGQEEDMTGWGTRKVPLGDRMGQDSHE